MGVGTNHDVVPIVLEPDGGVRGRLEDGATASGSTASYSGASAVGAQSSRAAIRSSVLASAGCMGIVVGEGFGGRERNRDRRLAVGASSSLVKWLDTDGCATVTSA
ncbi:hypothetical protein C446_07442 [Halobiforma nitratireducens JCM 10879]|uniref:Uncharacterized protein n=1 Tax=Halobiforma nitratireducens JCM 10879 TaxID=1227454 RepID=M0M785_9EURY|nr:hypothetical protein C446_07442 [Halobiforma nitratireducens JCM 10879]